MNEASYLRCGVEEDTGPADPVKLCGLPAVSTTVNWGGDLVGVCAMHEVPAQAAGYTLSRLPDREVTA